MLKSRILLKILIFRIDETLYCSSVVFQNVRIAILMLKSILIHASSHFKIITTIEAEQIINII